MLQLIRKMKRNPRLLMSRTRLIKGFSSLKGFPKFDKWAKLQTCHHCGNKGHVHQNCRKYLADRANGTLPPPGAKRLTTPAPAFNKDCCEK